MDEIDRMSEAQVTRMTNEIVSEMHCCRKDVNQQLATERIQLLRENQALADEVNALRSTIGQLEQEVKDERAKRQRAENDLMWAQKRIQELEAK